MTLLISEIIENVEKAPTKAEKIEILRKNDSPALREILRYGFHPNVRFFLKESPAYKPDHSPAGLSFSSLYAEYRRLYIFLEGDQESLITKKKPTKNDRKLQILLQILESVHPSESELLLRLITKSLKSKNLSKQIVEEAFPGLLS